MSECIICEKTCLGKFCTGCYTKAVDIGTKVLLDRKDQDQNRQKQLQDQKDIY